MGFLAAIPAKAWEILAGILLIAGFGAFCYVKGGEGPKAELAALQGQIKVSEQIRIAEDAKKEAQSKTIISQKDADNAKVQDAIVTAWSAYADSLRKPAGNGSAGKGKKPVSVTSTVCKDAASDQVVSAAISRYRSEVTSAIDDFREGVAGLLKSCDQNTAQLINLQQTITGIAAVNQ